ncbi:hypothetical protein BJV74DRAFT_133537 [Russula compacta]|nr:hypothetical protein BJV74DRAFT_133537 [Russula compacta]
MDNQQGMNPTQSFRGGGALNSSPLFDPPFIPTTTPPFYFFDVRPHPSKCPMASPFDRASDRHPTPPLSPSASSGSSRESSAPSFSPSPLSSLLRRGIEHLHSTCPDSRPLEYRDPTTRLGPITDQLEGDTMMLDDWEEEHERPEAVHSKQIPGLVCFQISVPFLALSACRIELRRDWKGMYVIIGDRVSTREVPPRDIHFPRNTRRIRLVSLSTGFILSLV